MENSVKIDVWGITGGPWASRAPWGTKGIDLNKKIKFSDIIVQSKISLEELQYSNDLFKRFFPEYKKDVKFENNSITIDYSNGDYKINGKSKININGDIDDASYSLKKINKDFFYDLNYFELPLR